MAVIGAGPAGFYTAYRVLSKLANAKVDMYESLPVPYGLVRFGVAPDHPEVKNCQDKFNQVAQDPRFTYIGNTPIGTSWPHPPYRSLPLAVLGPHYDALLLSYGASKDRKLAIPGEDTLAGVQSARAFVGWYNGLPEYRHLKLDLHLAEEATVIGQGNVALDVARMLLSRPDDLGTTDITEYAIEELRRSRVKRVRVVGRRGLLQAAFTVKELREMLSLQRVGFHPVHAPLLPEDPSSFPRAQKRIMQVLQKGPKTQLTDAEKSWELCFLRSPKAFIPSASGPARIGAIEFEKNRLEEPMFSPNSNAIGTGEREMLPTDLAFRSIGYLSERIPGSEDLGIPFNEKRGLVPNEDGRVVKPLDPKTGDPAIPVPGVYASGWVKRGPTGVIASTMYDAFDTGDRIVSDWTGGEVEFMRFSGEEKKLGWEAVRHEVASRGMRSISWAQWMRIDEAEKERGKRFGKEREKFTSEEEMLAVLE
ncbi:hypothetical protein HOY80DRAFT_896227 [Tuber brumale]|nr:hypothetical protein HOY80DRAFT_896227 [Tuber brumale]